MGPFVVICLRVLNCVLFLTIIEFNPSVIIVPPLIVTVLIIILILLIVFPFSYFPPKHNRAPDAPVPRFISRQREQFNKTGKKHMTYDSNNSLESENDTLPEFVPEDSPKNEIYSNNLKGALRLNGNTNLDVEEISESTDEGIENRIGEKIKKDRTFFLNNRKNAINFRSKRVNKKDVTLSHDTQQPINVQNTCQMTTYKKSEEGIFLDDIITQEKVLTYDLNLKPDQEKVPTFDLKPDSISLVSFSLASSESMNIDRYMDGNFPKMDVIDIEGQEVIVQVKSSTELHIALAVANHYKKEFCLENKEKQCINESQTLKEVIHHNEKDVKLSAKQYHSLTKEAGPGIYHGKYSTATDSTLSLDGWSIGVNQELCPAMISEKMTNTTQPHENELESLPAALESLHSELESMHSELESLHLHSELESLPSVSDIMERDDTIYSIPDKSKIGVMNGHLLEINSELGPSGVCIDPPFEPDVPFYDPYRKNCNGETIGSVSDSDDYTEHDHDYIEGDTEDDQESELTDSSTETPSSVISDLSPSESIHGEFIPQTMHCSDELQNALEIISCYQSRLSSLNNKNFKDSVIPSISTNQSQVSPVLKHPLNPTSSPKLCQKLQSGSSSPPASANRDKIEENPDLTNGQIFRSKNGRIEDKVVMRYSEEDCGVTNSLKVKQPHNVPMESSDLDDALKGLADWIDIPV